MKMDQKPQVDVISIVEDDIKKGQPDEKELDLTQHKCVVCLDERKCIALKCGCMCLCKSVVRSI